MSVDVERPTAPPRRRLRAAGPTRLAVPGRGRAAGGGGAAGGGRVAGGSATALAAAVRRTARSALARLRPVLDVVGPLGWLVLGTGIAAAWAGRHLGWLEAWTVAAVAGLLLVIAAGLAVGRSTFRVELGLDNQRVVVGEPASGVVTVTNTRSRPSLPARVELPVGGGRATFRLPRLAPHTPHENLFTIPTRRRGLIVLGPVLSVRGDALGLVRRQVRWTDPLDLYVHPRTVSLDGATSGFLRDIEGLPTQDLSSNDIAFHALRDYVAGDDRRAIHWRTTARTGRLVVRQFEETRRSHLVVALSTCAGDYASDDELELAVSVAASLGLQAIREEKQLSVLTSRGRVRATTPQRFLDELSLVEAGERDTPLSSLGLTVATAAPDASAIVLVAGSSVESASLASASVRLPIDALALAVRCAPGDSVARRTLGRLVVVTLGQLPDLPLVMRRATA